MGIKLDFLHADVPGFRFNVVQGRNPNVTTQNPDSLLTDIISKCNSVLPNPHFCARTHMEIQELHDPEFIEAFHHVDALQASSIDDKHPVHDSDLLTDTDPNIVKFEADDPENPLNWPQWRKWTVLVLVSMMNT